MEDQLLRLLFTAMFHDQYMRNCYDVGVLSKEDYKQYLIAQSKVLMSAFKEEEKS